MTSYVIFYLDAGRPKHFETTDLQVALTNCELLRKQQRAGDNIHHVCLSSENSDCVTKLGVDEVGPDYNWTKRR